MTARAASPPSCVVLAASLGLRRIGRRWAPCPACREARSKTDDRPPLLLDAKGWRCLLCGEGGGWGALLSWAVDGAAWSGHVSEAGRARMAEIETEAPRLAVEAPAPPVAPLPSPEELGRLLAPCGPLTWRAEEYLTSRRILDAESKTWSGDPLPAASQDYAPDVPDVTTATGLVRSLWYRREDLVVALVDAAGVVRSLHARRTDPSDKVKCTLPVGRSSKGLLMASPSARVWLRGGTRPERVVLVEGLTDYLMACSVLGRGAGVLGILSGSPPIPGVDVLCLDPDPPGTRYLKKQLPSSPSARVLRKDLCDAGPEEALRLLS